MGQLTLTIPMWFHEWVKCNLPEEIGGHSIYVVTEGIRFSSGHKIENSEGGGERTAAVHSIICTLMWSYEYVSLRGRQRGKRQARQTGRLSGSVDHSSRLHSPTACLRSIDCQTRRRRPKDITTWSIARSSTDSVTRPFEFLPSFLG